MSRDSRVYLADILEAAGKIKEYMAGMDSAAFGDDSKTQDAVVRNLEIIGEAVRALPDEIRSLRRDVEWRRISALRNILIHEYFGVEVAIIWDIVQHKVPVLEAAVRTMLAGLG